MLARCLFCQRPLPANDAVEHFPVGRRVAFDPELGRLWAVCPTCTRWSLAPIEERWEALEELEKLARDRARPLVQTDNIALLRAGELDVVRVGRAGFREEAWWRYGREMSRRYARSRALLWADVALALTIGFPMIRGIGRWTAFSRGVWLGVHRCPSCGASLTAGATTLKQTRRLSLAADAAGDIALCLDCRYCEFHGEAGRVIWTGGEARRILRSAVAYENYEGGNKDTLDTACARIEASGSPEAFIRSAAAAGPQLLTLAMPGYRPTAIALEMALNDDSERALLRAEAAVLEDHWRREEEIAAIMDGELTPLGRAR